MSGYRFLVCGAGTHVAAMAAFACLAASCKQAPPQPDAQGVLDAGPERGDRVVVEPRAAEFYEARVLSATPEKLRVQPSSGADPVSVALADVYRLPQPKVIPRRDQFLVCRVQGRWLGCQAEPAVAGRLVVRSVSGESHEIAPEDAFAPSELTELNLKRAFGRAAERARFLAAAARSGEPARPVGFRLLPKARVVARRQGAWYSGTVHEIDDAGAYIAFAGDELREHVASTDIVPEPPYPGAPTRGEFALLRPQSPAEPWAPVRIVSAAAGDFKVVNETGEERVVLLRELLPLSPDPL